MSNRTVVSVEERGPDVVEIRLSKAPVNIAGARVPKPFDCAPEQLPPWTAAGALTTHGRTIFDKLSAHEAIRQAISDIQRIQPSEVRGLYFHLLAADAERLAWEALCDANGRFLALDKRWPIARMADTVVDRRQPIVDFTPPLKIMALLSAIGRPARDEWAGLRKAAEEARAAGLPVELHVFVGEESLLDAVRADAAAAPVQWIEARPIPDRVVDLDSAMNAWKPHILHIYSHGSTASGVPLVQLATITDWDTDAASGSLIVTLDALAGFEALASAWLVTLNCCEGGRAEADLHSMAHSLVAGGLPAAIGMSEPIDAADAHEFAQVFYPILLRHVRTALAQSQASGTSVEFEWAPALHGPRTALRDRHGDANNRTWTLPVLYVRPETFELRVAPAAAADPVMRARIDAVAGALRALPPDAPALAREQLLAILADVPAALRPSLDGTFNGGV
jgi:hypothetical protein